jgi:hypothetical protein
MAIPIFFEIVALSLFLKSLPEDRYFYAAVVYRNTASGHT